MLELSHTKKIELNAEEVLQLFGPVDQLFSISGNIVSELKQIFKTWDSEKSVISNVYLKQVNFPFILSPCSRYWVLSTIFASMSFTVLSFTLHPSLPSRFILHSLISNRSLDAQHGNLQKIFIQHRKSDENNFRVSKTKITKTRVISLFFGKTGES